MRDRQSEGSEAERLSAADAGVRWRRFGPYLAERAWGTVREDYSADGDAWSYLAHDAARSTAYRWSEDGLAGICDDQQRLCLAWAFWNGADRICKERAFGLANAEGNHGEDVKEQYWYVDATPTASWLVWRYRYPISAFPYDDLVETNARRGRDQPEYELADTGVFDAGFFDIEVQLAKARPDDLVLLLRARNASAADAVLHVLPTLWFRNTWAWRPESVRPTLEAVAGPGGPRITADHPELGRLILRGAGEATPLSCDNETNLALRYGVAGPAFPKDGIGDHVVHGSPTVRLDGTGTRGALWYQLALPAGATGEVRLRLSPDGADPSHGATEAVLAARRAEADQFFDALTAGQSPALSPDQARVVRQGLAGLTWSQCFYHYNVRTWLDGDPAQPEPPAARLTGRNHRWRHLDAQDILTMPDAWEYPWFASWDTAFHCVALAHVNPGAAKAQLRLLLREWYSHPSGQLPAYEWNFSDANPPLHAWAALEIYAIDGATDTAFLERIFHKLLINFTWWVNREDSAGANVFAGGFLGMDNVGAFDRSHPLPGAGDLEQSDGTAWMAMYCLDMLAIALTLAQSDRAYEDIATKFLEHFALISTAMNTSGMWSDVDGCYYDLLRHPDGRVQPLAVRSIAGLVSLAAVRVLPASDLERAPAFADRLAWFRRHRPDLCAGMREDPAGDLLLAVVDPDRLVRLGQHLFDEGQFLSPHGLRSLSAWHRDHPYSAQIDGQALPAVDYEPAESRTGLFGGNSNWRGPVWFPLNSLVIRGLERYGRFPGAPSLEFPTGSGAHIRLTEAAAELSRRLVGLFLPDAGWPPPAAGGDQWPEGLLWFHEYFDGDTGKGLGASHQTGWTAMVADLILRPPSAEPATAARLVARGGRRPRGTETRTRPPRAGPAHR